MSKLKLGLISTDFDGTIHDLESPTTAIAPEFLQRMAQAQKDGVKWVVNTGRTLEDVVDRLNSVPLDVWPDYIVSVEREIHHRNNGEYIAHEQWNSDCHLRHQELFARAHLSLSEMRKWLVTRDVQLYEDAWSPLCIIASHLEEAEHVHSRVEEICREIPELCVMRNSIYFRFAHVGYSKGTALREVARILGVPHESVFAVGDHFNDIPMLTGEHARCVAAPSNAIPEVKEVVKKAGGFVASRPHAHGVCEALDYFG
jgi:HAD superfamily hydrolase (TIGR01484 family)